MEVRWPVRDVPESRWQFVQWQKALRTGLPATEYETAPQKQEPFMFLSGRRSVHVHMQMETHNAGISVDASSRAGCRSVKRRFIHEKTMVHLPGIEVDECHGRATVRNWTCALFRLFVRNGVPRTSRAALPTRSGDGNELCRDAFGRLAVRVPSLGCGRERGFARTAHGVHHPAQKGENLGDAVTCHQDGIGARRWVVRRLIDARKLTEIAFGLVLRPTALVRAGFSLRGVGVFSINSAEWNIASGVSNLQSRPMSSAARDGQRARPGE